MEQKSPTDLKEENDSLRKQLEEWRRVEEVLIAAGIVDREKFDQARDIVRTLGH